MPNFFEDLGKAAVRELANPGSVSRARMATVTSSVLNQHISGPLARDAMPRALATGPRYDQSFGSDQENMEPRGNSEEDQYMLDQDPDNGTPDAAACLAFVKRCMAGLQDEQRDMFVERLANMLQSEDAPASDQGLLNNNRQVLDRGRRGAADRRPPAQDAALRVKNTRSFNERWGSLTGGVSVDMARARR
jgi:hypothetical protein